MSLTDEPQDITGEQSVLGAMLLSKAAITSVVEVLTIADFCRRGHQIIFNRILDLYRRGQPADPVTVAAELERCGELLRVAAGWWCAVLAHPDLYRTHAGRCRVLRGDRRGSGGAAAWRANGGARA